MEKINLENYKLPNGLYTGTAEMYPSNTFVIKGQGKCLNTDGSSYEGEWDNNLPCGFGTYTFPDGDFHVGYFEDLPNGIGFANLSSEQKMFMGNYKDGKLNGWAIGLNNGVFNCSYMINGQIETDYTEEFEWMYFLLLKVFNKYKGGEMTFNKNDESFTYGAPYRTNSQNTYFKNRIGFTFAKDGSLLIGIVPDITNLNGHVIKCDPFENIKIGYWIDNALVIKENIDDIEKGVEFEFLNEENNNKVGIEDQKTPIPTYPLKTPLLEFAKIHGKMQVGNVIHSISGSEYKACIFTNFKGKKIIVDFSSTLIELTPKDIAENKEYLYVTEYDEGIFELESDKEELLSGFDLPF